MPTAAQPSDVEIAQARNLDIKCRAAGQCRTDSYPRHRNQAARRLLTSVVSLAIW
jgi:hypothetical protein